MNPIKKVEDIEKNGKLHPAVKDLSNDMENGK